MFRNFSIPGHIAQIAPARSEIMTFLEAQGCPEESCFEIGMAVQEALANAILHGCKQSEALTVSVEVATNDEGTTIVIRDQGPGFDVTQVRDPASVNGRVAQSGRGLAMMRAYMDDVAFTRGGSEVRMQKRWKTAQSA
jgi:serine/threonine-protein kinase RsbW